MSDKYGLLIAEDGKSITHGRPKYDSRRPTLIVDLERNPPHMDVKELQGGTAWKDDGTVTGRRQEIMFRMQHQLGFTPFVQAFFYNKSTQGYGNDVYLLSGSNGTVGDTFTFEADSNEFRLVHNFDCYGFTTNYTSTFPSVPFRVKYFIYSIKAGSPIYYGYPFDGLGQTIQQ